MANILIVDDAADIIHVLVFVVKKLGHNVSSAMNGTQALAMALEIQDLRLVFVDYNLPDMTGAMLAAQLKKQINGVKIIMVSGQEDMDAATLGVDAFILKPFTSDRIKNVLEKFL